MELEPDFKIFRVSDISTLCEVEKKDDRPTCGIYLNTGVKNSREHPMMIPVIRPDRPVFASLSLITADLEKDPIMI